MANIEALRTRLRNTLTDLHAVEQQLPLSYQRERELVRELEALRKTEIPFRKKRARTLEKQASRERRELTRALIAERNAVMRRGIAWHNAGGGIWAGDGYRTPGRYAITPAPGKGQVWLWLNPGANQTKAFTGTLAAAKRYALKMLELPSHKHWRDQEDG